MPRSLREQLILRVAGQVFAEGGYDRASMDHIAELAGVSKPMLYAYFGSKEGLYVAYIDRTGKELLDRLVRAGNEPAGMPARLHSRISEFLAFVEEHREGWVVLFREASASGPVAAEVATLRAQIASAVRLMIEAEIEPEFGLPPPATDAIAHAVVGAGESLANWWLLHPEVTREQVVNWHVTLVQSTVAGAIRSARSAM